MAFQLDLLDLQVGDGGEQLGVPIDQALVPVDEAVAMERDEHLQDRAREALVHGEALARPVARGAEPLELVDDDAAGFLLPLPHPGDEGLAPHVAAARLLALRELALDHHLGGDTRMIGAGLPQHVPAAHAPEAGQDVLQRVVERVPHVQGAGDVGRRDDDRIGRRFAALRTPGGERVGRLPGRIDAALDVGRLVGLFHRHRDSPARRPRRRRYCQPQHRVSTADSRRDRRKCGHMFH